MARGERMHAAIARQRKIIAKDERVKQETLPAIPSQQNGLISRQHLLSQHDQQK